MQDTRGHGHIRQLMVLLERVIHLELHQDLVPEPRACHPVGGEGRLGAMFSRRQRFVGQRGVNLGQPPPALPFLFLVVDLLVDPYIHLTPGPHHYTHL
jgi:hypothetical protein